MARLARMTAWSIDEDALVQAAQAGDRGAFDGIVRARFAQVYGVLFRLVGNHEDAEDLAQECFVKAYESLRFYRGEGRFEAWLLRIALHLARDHYRRSGRSGAALALAGEGFDPEARGGEPVHDLSHRELVGALGEAIDRLPEGLRAALVLRVLEGMEYEDVAEATGLRPGTVRTQVMKARRTLARVLAPWLERSPR